MQPVLHRRVSREPSDRSSNESYLSSSSIYRSATLSPIHSSSKSSQSPLLKKRRSTTIPIKYNDHTFSIITTIVCLMFIILWIYLQYQFIPSSSDIHNSNKKSYLHNLSTSHFQEISHKIHSQCRFAYSHSLSDIGNINLTLSEHVPFLQFLTFSDYGIIKHKNDENENINSLLQLINVINSYLPNSHFAISAGDHFYDNDVNYAQHPRWDAMFDHFIKNKLFLSVSGNIDWMNTSHQMDIQNIVAQIERTYWSNNWCFPRLYYTIKFSLRNKVTDTLSFNVRFIALDTTSYLHKYDQFKYLTEQYKWLYNVLETNKNDDWIIVFGHHPFEHVPEQKKEQISNQQKKRNRYTFPQLQRKKTWNTKMEKILKLLLQYDNVIMYVSGHHHIWRVCNIVDKNDQIKLLSIVTGSTGKHNHHFNSELPLHMIAGGEEQSFGKISIYKDMLKLQIIDKENRTLFSHLYQKYIH
eukprot:159927_1